VNKIDYLILSSSFDYSTDLVCYRLLERGCKYYRLNRDEFKKHRLCMDLQRQRLIIQAPGIEYYADFVDLKGVYFRAPVFLRTQSKKELSLDEQLERNQWSSFIRNLTVFQNANWVNSPVETYRAENKMLQLCKAKQCHLQIPKTWLTNDSETIIGENVCIVKSLDTALFYDFQARKEMFTYTNVISCDDLQKYDLSQSPVIVQEFLEPKVDCRVTYVNGKMFPVKILFHDKGVVGDWRSQKEGLHYEKFNLPQSVMDNLCLLMNCLNLKFGGIDLALHNGKYYFIEVNPTGEWGWLETVAGLEISDEICNTLIG
jgi:glutathione synthase/RimK-type ligase-like ATP-grasp enzyme